MHGSNGSGSNRCHLNKNLKTAITTPTTSARGLQSKASKAMQPTDHCMQTNNKPKQAELGARTKSLIPSVYLLSATTTAAATFTSAFATGKTRLPCSNRQPTIKNSLSLLSIIQ